VPGGVKRRGAATRPCPACGWEIQSEAVKCRYCGSAVVQGSTEQAEACWLCRIAAGLCVLLLLAGVIVFLFSVDGL
jgi:hypothetical protein